ncbi:MAG: glycosidase [Candidatus Bathyarchaeia archaeon]
MGRFEGNPIIKPVEHHPWESRYVFNPAMIRLGGRIHIFYRAMGEDMVSRLGYASSEDGYNINERLPYPVFEPVTPSEWRGCEDPRLTLLEGRCLMTYTAYGDIYQIGITTISVDYILEKRWEWGERYYPFPNIRNKNAVIFPDRIRGRYAMFHRLDPSIYISYSDDLRSWDTPKLVMIPRKDSWDCVKIGSASPPIELDSGWLLIYHGVDEKRTYRLGAAIFEKENPERIVYRTKEPILEPDEDYERLGFVPNVVFSCGSVLMDSKLLISYGGADTVIGVATFDLSEIIK